MEKAKRRGPKTSRNCRYKGVRVVEMSRKGQKQKRRRMNNYVVIGGEGGESQRLPDLW